jgi:hypothetical protein
MRAEMDRVERLTQFIKVQQTPIFSAAQITVAGEESVVGPNTQVYCTIGDTRC